MQPSPERVWGILRNVLFLDRLRDACRRFPARTAIDFRDPLGQSRRLSYEELIDSIARTATWLEGYGVQAGDRVAVGLPKSVATIQIHLAACSLGAVSLPVNPAYTRSEIRYLLQDSAARLLVVGNDGQQGQSPSDASTSVVAVEPAEFEDLLPTAGKDLGHVPIASDQTALMLYTSGTTGRPKGACMSHASLTANMAMLNEAWQWSADDVLLHALPLFHVHGLLVAMHGALYCGATSVVHASFDGTAVLRAIRTHECTVFMAVPAMYRRLLNSVGDQPVDLRHMRLLTSGSDRLPVDLFRQIESRFGMRPVERYGMTETGIMLSNPLTGERVAGQVGTPLPGVEMRIVDPESDQPVVAGAIGEFQTRGPHVFAGYWQAPEKTRRSFTQDGWFRTGDLGRVAENGGYELKGRRTDLVISGGYNVYPSEVEHVLLAHPDVEQCTVIGLPDPAWGESVTAVVVPCTGRPDETDLIQHCRGSLASYKTPKRIVFADSIPRNAMGKVQKQVIRDELERTGQGGWQHTLESVPASVPPGT